MTYQKSNPESVRALFSNVAARYDLTNGIASLGLHLLWNRRLRRALQLREGASLLDLCCGTGAISLPMVRKLKCPCSLYLVDFCQPMLDCAKERARRYGVEERHALSFLCANAEQLPLEDETVEYCSLAYGVRNIARPERAFAELYRVGKPGARIAILELTRPSSPLISFGHKLYLRSFLPLIGRLCTSDEQAYRYLCETIGEFMEPSALCAMMRESGFSQVSATPLSGGIVHLFLAQK